ncbi:MAG: F420-dependent methylenetetrahydromethanopterin dehydrogenase [Sulfolobales archaeon]|nr:F420-dependent methylenetetrahydromethanopterin dehydrogenase [Sulfolobales archaeon]MCX8198461.1 F420-dependent methylenetetrahydromethanopterin dehydrogenase [Sulfolobales archaeon]MDW8169535.1 F420-dependent methylenetetrahydromethanopterin dehydrogenase [Desulfurococcaceae archaeon]
MLDKVIKICILKMGCIASAPLLEYILDERADRKDIEVRVLSVGSKLAPEDYGVELAEKGLKEECDLYIVVSPNAALPGPTKAREVLREKGKSVIVISDAPAKKITKELDEKGFGYIIVLADSMIGARREFLDPVEMTIFNGDIIKVLAITGVYRLIQVEVGKVIDGLKRGEKPVLPRVVVDKEIAINAAQFKNAYAKAKAMAAYEVARKVADLTTEGCFVVKESERYIPIVAAAHEMMRYAALLADEAREIEKYGDTLVRTPHSTEGAILYKEKLMEKPQVRG